MIKTIAAVYLIVALLISLSIALLNKKTIIRLGFWKLILLFTLSPLIVIAQIFRK